MCWRKAPPLAKKECVGIFNPMYRCALHNHLLGGGRHFFPTQSQHPNLVCFDFYKERFWSVCEILLANSICWAGENPCQMRKWENGLAHSQPTRNLILRKTFWYQKVQHSWTLLARARAWGDVCHRSVCGVIIIAAYEPVPLCWKPAADPT